MGVLGLCRCPQTRKTPNNRRLPLSPEGSPPPPIAWIIFVVRIQATSLHALPVSIFWFVPPAVPIEHHFQRRRIVNCVAPGLLISAPGTMTPVLSSPSSFLLSSFAGGCTRYMGEIIILSGTL